MKKSKLIGVFQSLTDLERRSFRKMLQSPFFNQRKDILELYDYLCKSQLNGQVEMSKQKAWNHLYPGQAYKDANMRHCISFLFRLIEKFLLENSAALSTIEQKAQLSKVYRERNLDRHFQHSIQAARRMLDKLPQDQQFYHFNYLVEQEQYRFDLKRKRSVENNLKALGHSYDVQFLANKLKQSCLQLSHQALYRVDYDTGLLNTILKFLENSPLLNIPAIAIYFYCYRALTENREEDFIQLKKQFLTHQHQFPADEMSDVLLLSINFCIKQLNTGKETYVREAFELYRSGLESKLLLTQSSFSRFTFKNIVALGLRLGETEWIEQFIEGYHTYLDERFRASYHAYNLARLAYFKKDYQKAMPLLVTIDSTDLMLNIDSKVLLLKMYFELQEHDALDALLASFKTYLQRKKVMGYHRDNYLDVIAFTKKILYLNKHDRPAKKKLFAEIDKSQVTEKEWLKSQLYQP